MAHWILYHPRVLTEDLPAVNRNLYARISRAIEHRLTTEPVYYGEPLRHRLKGFWKLRVGDYRIIFRVSDQTVLIVAIGHRKDVYAGAPQRILWKP